MNNAVPRYKVAKILSYIIATILVLVPFHAVFTTWLASNFNHFDLFRIWKEVILVAMIPFCGYLIWSSKELKHWFMHSPIVWLIRVYVLLHIILGVWALHNYNVNQDALTYALIINLRFLIFFLVCYVAAASCDFLVKRWRAILLIPAGVVVLFGLMQRFFLPYDFLRHFGYSPSTIPAYQTVDSSLDFRRIQSTLRGANPLGAYLVLIISSFWAILRKNRNLQVGTVLLAFIVLFYSYSRSAWIGAILSLGVLVWLQSTKINKSHVIGVLVALAVVAICGVFLIQNNQTIEKITFHSSDSSTSDSSNDVRLGAITSAARQVADEPLGEGPGTAGPASNRNDWGSRIAENYYLQIGQELAC